jgi:dihydrofolate synthase/folylpolyglutamate synthase
MSDLKSTLGRLYALIPRGRKLELERVQAASAKLGNPERNLGRVVHVAGTNGKGTVCHFTASIARAAGLKVGLYTSPHLCQFAERIQIDGANIPEADLVRVLGRVLDECPDLTFFETATLAAFLAFQEAGVELSVLEVGLGGRFDATNVIPPPEVAVVTRVAFDHMAELGDSLAKIAVEKAGIIKPGSKLVLGRLHPDARDVIEKKAAEVGAEILPLKGPEPIPGAPLAYPRVTVAHGMAFTPEHMAQGIEHMTLPGRNELLHRNGQELTLLDCAHNPDGAVALSHSLDPSVLGDVESKRDVALVFGALKTKNWKAMLRRLEQVAGHRIFVAPPIGPDKAVPARQMAAFMNGEAIDGVADALARARTLVGSRGVVVVTGSTFLVGAARALLLGLPTDPPVDL